MSLLILSYHGVSDLMLNLLLRNCTVWMLAILRNSECHTASIFREKCVVRVFMYECICINLGPIILRVEERGPMAGPDNKESEQINIIKTAILRATVCTTSSPTKICMYVNSYPFH